MSGQGTTGEFQQFEVALQGVLSVAGQKLGKGRLRDILMQDFLRREAEMRASYPPDHPALQLLDEHHAAATARGDREGG